MKKISPLCSLAILALTAGSISHGSLCSDIDISVQLAIVDANGFTPIPSESQVEAGTPIALLLSAQNTGQVVRVLNMNHLQLTNSRNGFTVVVSEQGAELVSPILLPQGPEMDRPVQLLPGAKEEGSIVLTTYFPELSRKGQFQLRVVYNWEWPFYILTRNGSRHPYEVCRCESEDLRLHVVPRDTKVDASAALLGATDGDLAAHIIFALVNSSAHGAATPTAEELSRWGSSHARLYIETLLAHYPQKVHDIMEAIISTASPDARVALQRLLKHPKYAHLHKLLRIDESNP